MKNITLHLADEPRKEAMLGVAVSLALQFGSSLTGVVGVPGLTIPSHAAVRIPAEAIEQFQSDQQAEAKRLTDSFRNACARNEIASQVLSEEASPLALLTRVSRSTDLVIIGQTDPDRPSRPEFDILPQQLVLAAACPVCIVPYAGRFATVGRRIMVAWNDSREASRAVRDAMPLLRRAELVKILAVNPSRSWDIPCADIAAYLAHHGVKAEAAHAFSQGIDTADSLVSSLSDFGADFLVMGAWGHSRFTELMLGGVTRGVLAQMTVPTLLSH